MRLSLPSRRGFFTGSGVLGAVSECLRRIPLIAENSVPEPNGDGLVPQFHPRATE
jgi:hypothetical protein